MVRSGIGWWIVDRVWFPHVGFIHVFRLLFLLVFFSKSFFFLFFSNWLDFSGVKIWFSLNCFYWFRTVLIGILTHALFHSLWWYWIIDKIVFFPFSFSYLPFFISFSWSMMGVALGTSVYFLRFFSLFGALGTIDPSWDWISLFGALRTIGHSWNWFSLFGALGTLTLRGIGLVYLVL